MRWSERNSLAGIIAAVAFSIMLGIISGHAWAQQRGEGYRGGHGGGGGHGVGFQAGRGRGSEFHGGGFHGHGGFGPGFALGLGAGLAAPYAWGGYAPPDYYDYSGDDDYGPYTAAQFWYYCNYPSGYYPYVTQCYGPWAAGAGAVIASCAHMREAELRPLIGAQRSVHTASPSTGSIACRTIEGCGPSGCGALAPTLKALPILSALRHRRRVQDAVNQCNAG
jgi:hypothetical protein